MNNSLLPAISVKDLTVGYGDTVVLQDVTFDIPRGSIFVIMGGSGCGKSTILNHLLGLIKPRKGTIFYGSEDFLAMDEEEQAQLLRQCGVLYQGGALWSSMTLFENISLPLELFTKLTPTQIREVVRLKLDLVGLSGFEDFYPAELSGGMRKRAGLARAMALDPEILFFDEPSAGLDPVSSVRLDNLISELAQSLKTTVVLVTHELPSIFGIGTDAIFLDAGTKRLIAQGSPKELLEDCKNPAVQEFLRRESNA
jgi:phospholipid/cholesterol/gamma-HCH transport system ATP-binding protein